MNMVDVENELIWTLDCLYDVSRTFWLFVFLWIFHNQLLRKTRIRLNTQIRMFKILCEMEVFEPIKFDRRDDLMQCMILIWSRWAKNSLKCRRKKWASLDFDFEIWRNKWWFDDLKVRNNLNEYFWHKNGWEMKKIWMKMEKRPWVEREWWKVEESMRKGKKKPLNPWPSS